MNEAQLYELLGRKQADLEALHREYDRVLALLSHVLSGDVHGSRVRVDLAGRRWEIVGTCPDEPPVENGVPLG